MKKILIIAAVMVGLLGVTAGLLYLNVCLQSPEYLLWRLSRAGGSQTDDLVMRLNVARGPVVECMLQAFHDPGGSPEFRSLLAELLVKRHVRLRDERIEQAIAAAVNDPQPAVRAKVAYCLAAYGEEHLEGLQVLLADVVDDPEPAVRRQVYLVFGAGGSIDNPEKGIWQQLLPEQREKLLNTCLEAMKTENSAEMRTFARAIVGREIEIRSFRAQQALQESDVAKAEEILLGALELDPQSHQAQVRLVRFLLKTGDTEKALEMGRRYNALVEVPMLSQAPTIDGDPQDAVWQEAYKADKFYHTTSRWVARQTEGRSEALIGHLDGKVYVAVIGYEPDLSLLIRKAKERDGATYHDDCAEILFDPGMTEKDYYQFVINSLGVLFDQCNADKTKDFKCEYAANVFTDRGYWACEFALDGKDLDNHPIKSGTMWAIDLFRTRIGAASEHGAMWPVYGMTKRRELYPIALFK